MATSRRILFPHTFKVGTIDYLIDLPDIYDDGATSNIGSAMGIKKLPANYEAKQSDVKITISDGMKNGLLMRVRVSFKDGTALTAKTKSSRVVCPVSYASGGIAALKSKKIDGNNVIGAGIPRRRRLG